MINSSFKNTLMIVVSINFQNVFSIGINLFYGHFQ